MRTIREAGSAELVERKSRFLCLLQRVETEQRAREFVRECRGRHPDARHHCYAYVLGDAGQVRKSNDDGEPSGTAGVPILEVLHRNELTNTVAVVVRYFGGVLLGSGGLIRAYGAAVSRALEAVGTVPRRRVRTVTVTLPHSLAGKLDHELRAAGRPPLAVRYGAGAEFDVAVPEEAVSRFREWIVEHTGGAAGVEQGELVFTEIDE
ncbi:YigZ family protein [Actinopolyspora mortivallis]|uniref:YigZ family protein n=1 Tax=Actinopolyspora mortivallis TaxID=33906 RepID=UPI00047DC677|nr:YigZ family protein [Actinopolyspora mortivallis]